MNLQNVSQNEFAPQQGGFETDLVERVDGDVRVCSRVLAKKFGKLHKNVLRDIDALEIPAEYHRLNFEPGSYLDGNGQERPLYLMTRDGFSLLAMGFTGKKAMGWKLKFIEAFNIMEAEVAARPQIPQSLPEALRLAADECDRANRAETKLLEVTPKVEAYERLEAADGSVCITDAAKMLKMRPKDMFAYLQAHHWIYRRVGGSWIGYQSKVQSGVLEHNETTITTGSGFERVRVQVRATPKGLAKLAAMLEKGLDS